ncbi:hypothetical protein HDU76_006516 [Blyttiomyces sp. JEL0837]|nr:hypothetical protein HDU76_006516 [Blyttiomyces sp. JEL0837]
MAAIITHNLMAPMSEEYYWAWAFDVAFTGSSSFCLIMASIYHPFPVHSKPPKPTPTSQKLLFAVLIPSTILTLSILGIAYPATSPVKWTSEVLYIGITVLAAVVLVVNIIVPAFSLPSTLTQNKGKKGVKLNPVTAAGKLALIISLLGVFLILLGFPLDRPMCEISRRMGVITEFGMVHCVFGGCAIAFQAFLGYVLFGCRDVDFEYEGKDGGKKVGVKETKKVK